jgi:hypothetical protein
VTRPRRKLRTRLLVAMMAIALGVLLLTAAVTAGLARRTEVNTARHDVQDRVEVVAPEFDTLIKQLPAAKAATSTVMGRRQIRRIRNLVNNTLRAVNGAVVAVYADANVQEVLGRLLAPRARRPPCPTAASVDRPRHPGAARRLAPERPRQEHRLRGAAALARSTASPRCWSSPRT